MYKDGQRWTKMEKCRNIYNGEMDRKFAMMAKLAEMAKLAFLIKEGTTVASSPWLTTICLTAIQSNHSTQKSGLQPVLALTTNLVKPKF